jgi:methionine synthase II (cobalamin-independent)
VKRSRDRILTTHAGSLPRPADLLDMLRARSAGHPSDHGAYAARVRRAVAEVVRAQVEHGLDVIDDGVTLPEGAVLIPGVITQSSVLVGRENVIAGADCGFATFAGSTEIHPTIAWAKLRSLAEGARLATRHLWGRA